MPIFRFHMGSLKESMKTCKLVKNKGELWDYIFTFNKATGEPTKNSDSLVISSSVDSEDHIIIRPYIWDERIGWDTHIVLIDPGCVTMDCYVEGFLSENFK